MKYQVSVESKDMNLSYSMQTLYTFEANSDEEALAALDEEHKKARGFWRNTSRLVSGGIYWRNARIYKNNTNLV